MLVDETNPILKCSTVEYEFDNPPEIISAAGASTTLENLVDSMLVAMKINGGIGLAAPQVGQKLRLFVMEIDGEEFVCINPEIIEQSSELVAGKEGCLSFPNLTLTVKRPKEVFVSYKNLGGVAVKRWLQNLSARCFCHELDHLNGITFDTRVPNLSLKMAKQKRQKLMKQQKRTRV